MILNSCHVLNYHTLHNSAPVTLEIQMEFIQKRLKQTANYQTPVGTKLTKIQFHKGFHTKIFR